MALVIGTAGHIDHGKSALVEALTGIHPDRLPEEKRRGMTLDLGFGHFTLPSGEAVGVVDVPGHERFVHSMAAGAFAVDLVLLVVAADDGIMPQTREHLAVCNWLGIKRGVVVISKLDLTDAPRLEKLQGELKTFLRGSFLEHSPCVAVSAKSGLHIEALRQAIQQEAKEIRRPVASSEAFRLWVDRSFSARGHGTVVTGTALSGICSKDMLLRVLPGEREVRVRGVQVHGQARDTAQAGERVALNLSGVEVSDVARGVLLTSSKSVRCVRRVWVALNLSAAPKKSQINLQMLVGTASTPVRLRLFPAASAGKFFARLDLSCKLPVARGDRMILRDTTPASVAGGIVLSVFPEVRGKKSPLTVEHLSDLEKYLAANDDAAVEKILFDAYGRWGLSLEALRANFNDQFKSRAVEVSGILIWPDSLERETQAVLNLTDAGGSPRDLLLQRLCQRQPKAARGFYEAVIDHALSQKKLEWRDNLMRRCGQAPALPSGLQNLLQDIQVSLNQAALQPPSVAELTVKTKKPEAEIRKVLGYLAETKAAVKINHDFFMASGAVEKLYQDLKKFFAASLDLDVAAFKNLTGATRKHAIPLLEFLDRERFTLRVGEKRRLRKN